MKKKKTVKVTPKKVAVKKSKKGKPAKQQDLKLKASGSIQDTVLQVLNHLLEVSKAALYDSFKQYIEARMCNGLPATLEEFIALFTNSFAIHGISDEQLVASLDERGQTYLKNSAKLLEAGNIMKKTATSVITVTDKASNVTTQKSGTVIQNEQAAKIDPNEFDLATPAAKGLNGAKVTDAQTGKSSVFSDLDVL